MSGYVIKIFREKNGWTVCKQWRPWSAASDLGLHCLPIICLRFSVYNELSTSRQSYAVKRLLEAAKNLKNWFKETAKFLKLP